MECPNISKNFYICRVPFDASEPYGFSWWVPPLLKSLVTFIATFLKMLLKVMCLRCKQHSYVCQGLLRPWFGSISREKRYAGVSPMKVATFNANGIRARLSIILEWLAKESPDVLCLQETKVQDGDFPRQPIEDLGYQATFRGQKAYNGVAILSKRPPETVSFGFGDGDVAEEPRLVTAIFHDMPIVNTYVPQGYAPESEKFKYKLGWFRRLKDYFSEHFTPSAPLLWAGDFNVAPEPLDVYDPEKLLGSVGFHPKEQAALAAVKAWGFVDVFRKHEKGSKMYTFWDYRLPQAVKRGLGWRIDHLWTTPSLAEKSIGAWIDMEPRLAHKPSDHTFVIAEFDMG
jgi:exodeoxyribonuclease-3